MAPARPFCPQTLQSTAVLLVQAYICEEAYRAFPHGPLLLVIPCRNKAWGRLALGSSGKRGAGDSQEGEGEKGGGGGGGGGFHLFFQTLAAFCDYQHGLCFLFAQPGPWEYKFIGT